MVLEKSKFDVLGKIERERLNRNWTEYTLAKNAGIAQSTISTWYRKQLQPSIASIEKICGGFGITLSEFFVENDSGSALTMTDDQRELFEGWARLNPSQKRAIVSLIKSIDS
ncbi:MAG: helix-turn-helix domain-containing protein [Eubacteriales bacterium]|nr:helix-turn-helix domain-containing protein [Eubacteriales bacterium]